MVTVGCILDDAFRSAQAAFMVNVLNGGKLFHHPLMALQSDAVQLPYHTRIQLVRMLSMVQ